MNIIDRVKNILITPAKEWDVINSEQPDIAGIITGYVLPLAGAAAVAAFIGHGFIWLRFFGGISWAIYYALIILAQAIGSVLICALVIDALAPGFGSEKNMGRSVQLVAYSFTPMWIGLLLSIFPPLAIIGSLAGLYGFYLLYVGMAKLKKTAEDKLVGYYVISIIITIAVYFIIAFIMGLILLPILGLSFGFGRRML